MSASTSKVIEYLQGYEEQDTSAVHSWYFPVSFLWSVWPDLVKFHHFGNILKFFDNWFEGLFSIGQFFRHWSPHFIDGIWAKNGKNYLAIWSHCLWSKVIGKCVHLVIVSSCKSRRFWSVSRPNCLAAELSYWVSFILRKSVWQQFGRDSLKHSIKVEHLKNCRFIATPRFFEALIWKRKRVWIFVELSVIF